MGVRYELTCQCGRKYPVDTARAGQEILCDCGATLKIPTMMKIKRLPVWNESDAAGDFDASGAETSQNAQDAASDRAASSAQNDADGAENVKRKSRVLSPSRLGLLIVGGAAFALSSFFFCSNVREPNPLDVFYKQQTYSIDGKAIRRDSSPIEQGDFDFYFLYEPTEKNTYLVDDVVVDAMSLFYAYRYFDAVKELGMSDNFYENYETLKARRVIRLVGWGIAGVVGLIVALLALFLPESKKQVGTMRGADWR